MDFLYFQVNIPTAALDSADEQVLLYKFPDEGDVWMFRDGNTLDTDDTVCVGAADFQVSVTTLDSSTSSVWDIGIGDVDGVIDTALISNSTIGQTTAGTDLLDAPGLPVDVSGKYLIFDVTTAAKTAVAGSVTVKAKVCGGIKLEVDSGVA